MRCWSQESSSSSQRNKCFKGTALINNYSETPWELQIDLQRHIHYSHALPSNNSFQILGNKVHPLFHQITGVMLCHLLLFFYAPLSTNHYNFPIKRVHPTIDQRFLCHGSLSIRLALLETVQTSFADTPPPCRPHKETSPLLRPPNENGRVFHFINMWVWRFQIS